MIRVFQGFVVVVNKLVYAVIICSAIPGVIIVPLVPFTFLIVDGEGRVPGLLHEYAFMALLLAYPLLLLGGIFLAPRLLRGQRARHAMLVAVAPLACALLLVWVFVIGGIRLH